MGRPKAWLPFAGELMLPRVVRLLSEAVSPVVVVAAADQELPPLSADVIVTHDPQPDRGPLVGLVAGLDALPAGVAAAFVSSCDAPLLRPAFVRQVIELLGESQVCVPQVEDWLQPLAAVYRRDILPYARQLLQDGTSRLTDLVAAVPARLVAAVELTDADPDLCSLRNLNTPEDYAAALRDVGSD
jgi:molybdopterin-guanine dinucleotide biosynthesis protein A